MIKNFFISLFILFFFNVINPVHAVSQDSLPFLFEKALIESREGNFIDALESWDDFLTLSPEDAAALSNRGNIRLALGDIEGAIVDQTKSIEILPLEIDPHLNRGIAQEALKQWNKAKEDYEWVLQKEPENFSALYNLANVMGSEENWHQAKLLFDKASMLNPGLPMARSSKSLACYQLSQYDEAEKELRALIRKYPMFADARAALSALLWRKGSLGEAESHWNAVVGLDVRYKSKEWLVNARRWPSKPAEDLMSFLALKTI